MCLFHPHLLLQGTIQGHIEAKLQLINMFIWSVCVSHWKESSNNIWSPERRRRNSSAVLKFSTQHQNELQLFVIKIHSEVFPLWSAMSQLVPKLKNRSQWHAYFMWFNNCGLAEPLKPQHQQHHSHKEYVSSKNCAKVLLWMFLCVSARAVV